MAAPGLTEPRCASERGLAMGGGRPAKLRFTVGGSGKSVARCHHTVLAYWKFESIPLQQRVHKLSVPERRTISEFRVNAGVQPVGSGCENWWRGRFPHVLGTRRPQCHRPH